jgi:hypothetical protein
VHRCFSRQREGSTKSGEYLAKYWGEYDVGTFAKET